jgi:NAD(P)-dependent dehydrogenase (short-subunit alcohol dehydrogenase family)
MSARNPVAIVTGGGSGIGRAVALALAADGYLVTVAGRRPAAIEAVAKSAEGLAGEVAPVTADVTDAESVESLFDEVRRRFGRLDLLFNNAGVGAPTLPVDELSLDEWRLVLETNVTGSFLCTRAAFRLMKTQDPGGGRIINNGSLSADVPRPHSAPYTTSKHAITGLTRATALDGRAHGIACGQINVGNAETGLLDAMGEEGLLQPNGSLMVEPRMSVDDVARAVLYMAGLPLESNVLFMTVMATGMPFVGRG